MNGLAVAFGLTYGCLSAAVFYAVSMLTSGLFARPSYRLYARVLIGICSVMLAAPGLRWLTNLAPMWGVVGLTATQYLAMGVLLLGVVRFNNHILPQLIEKRAMAVYFILGTWANATLVSLLFLQFSVSGATTWEALGSSRAFLTVGHYGPTLMLLAAMVFHADHRLKSIRRQPIHFTRFTFVGYTLAFLGVVVSLLPFASQALSDLALSAHQWSALQSASCAQTLFIAIVVFAWLIWRYETIPPLFALLAVIIGEYHVLVTQWVIYWLGPHSWALACLPLVMGLSRLEGYFSHWETRKRKSRAVAPDATAPVITDADEQRFAWPFRLMAAVVGGGVCLLPLWFRLAPTQADTGWWLAWTYSVYAAFGYWLAWSRGQAAWLYVANALAVLAAVLGFSAPGQPLSAITLSGLGLAWAASAAVGGRLQWERRWRTAWTDGALVASVMAWGLVLSRHFWGATPYALDAVSWVDAASLATAFSALLVCAYQYRSCLPAYLALAALATIAPTQCAVIGLLAMGLGSVAGRLLRPENKIELAERLRFLGRVELPLVRPRSELFRVAFSNGVIPLGIGAMALGVIHFARATGSLSEVLGLAASSLTLGLATRVRQDKWVFASAILAGYLAVHAAAQTWLLSSWPLTSQLTAHACLAAGLSLGVLGVVGVCGWWCRQLLARVAEEREVAVLQRGRLYCGGLLQATVLVALVTLVLLGWAVWFAWPAERELLLLAAILGPLFCGLAVAYRTQVATYLALSAWSLGWLLAEAVTGNPWLSGAWVFAGVSLGATLLANGLRDLRGSDRAPKWGPPVWDASPPTFLRVLPAASVELWRQPLVVYAVLCGIAAVGLQTWRYGVLPVQQGLLLVPSTASIALLVSLSWLFTTRVLRSAALYWCGWTLGLCGMLVTIHTRLLGGELQLNNALELLGAAACFGIVATLTASGWSIVFQNRAYAASEGESQGWHASRQFFAGQLQHFSFVVLLAVSGLLVAMVAQVETITEAAGLRAMAVCGLLVGGFAWLASVYRSRILTYLSLSTIALGMALAFDLWNVTDHAIWDSPLPLAALSSGLAVAACLLSPRKRVLGQQAWEAEGRLPKCWVRPPLPALALGWSLWAKPLADVSLITIGIALGQACAAAQTISMGMWIAVALATWLTCLLGTFSYRLGVLPILAAGLAERAVAYARWDQRERRLLFALSLLGLLAVPHLYLQLEVLVNLPRTVQLPWHLLLASVLCLGLWSLSSCVAQLLRRRARDIDTDKWPPAIAAAAQVYAGVPLRLSGLVAGGALVFGVWQVFLPHIRHWPTNLTFMVLAGVFALLAGSYRARVASYLSLGCGLMGCLLCCELWVWADGLIREWLPSSLAAGGLLLVVFGSLLQLRVSQAAGMHPPFWPMPFALPRPWSTVPWNGLWARPAGDSALVCLAIGCAVGVASFVSGPLSTTGGWHLLAGCGLGILSFVMAAKLYRSTLPTYIACGLLGAAVFPLSTLIDKHVSELSVTWALLATGYWLIGFTLERWVPHARKDAPESPAWVQLYVPPLLRSSAALSVLAIAGCLGAFVLPAFQIAPQAAFLTCSVGALTLLLCARSAGVIQRTMMARVLVYLACVAITGGVSVVAFDLWGLSVLGATWASIAFVLSLAGAWLLSFNRDAGPSDADSGGQWRLFGEPAIFSAMVLSFAGLTINLSLPVSGIWELTSASTQLCLALTMVLASLSFAVGVRTFHHLVWWHLAVFWGALGVAVALAVPWGWAHPTTLALLLVWASCLMCAARWLHAQESRTRAWTGLGSKAAEWALYLWSMTGIALMLVWQAVNLLPWAASALDSQLWIVTAGLLCIVIYQACYPSFSIYPIQLLVIATIVAVCWIARTLGGGWFPLDVWLVCLGIGWSSFSLWLTRSPGASNPSKLPGLPALSEPALCASALHQWSMMIILAGLVVALPSAVWDEPEWPSVSLTIFLATMGFVWSGWQRRSLFSLTGSLLLFPTAVGYAIYHAGGFTWLTATTALSAALVACLYACCAGVLLRTSSDRSEFTSAAAQRLRQVSDGLLGLAFVMGVGGISETGGGLLSVVTMSIVGCAWLVHAFATMRERYVYAGMVAIGLAGVTLIKGYLGWAMGPSPILAFAVLATSWMFFAINSVVSRGASERLQVLIRPSYYLANLVPVGLLVSIPFHQPDVAALCMLACGAYYLIVSYHSRHDWAMYVAILSFNVAVYLWMPTVHGSTGLWQLYVHPAALSVLLFAHLHRRELPSRVLGAIRYAASGAILATATLEVFASSQASLTHFVIVLALSLLGIASGIALRVRPFVFIGVSFLMLNVIGQVGLQFHREGGIIRAVILISVGILVLAAMIFFNVYRERILREYRRFLADPEWQ